MKKLINLERAGIAFIVVVGSLFHFTWEWSGRAFVVALFSAVNESTFEHLKLAFWPAVLWTAYEARVLKPATRGPNFWAAKAVSLGLAPVLIAVLFEGWVFLTGDHHLAIDIGVFLIAIFAAQAVGIRVAIRRPLAPALRQGAPVALIALALLFIAFTIWPPHLGLFVDPVDGGYGLPGEL